MADELQALCFLAGANSIFYGEKLLTTGNPDVARDRALLTRLGIEPLVPPGLAAARRTRSEPTSTCTVPTARTDTRRAAGCRMQRDPAALKAALADLEQRNLQRTRRRDAARRPHQFLQQRLPRAGARIPRWCARSWTPRRSTAWAAALRTWSPATAPNTRRWRRSSRRSPGAKRRWFSPRATWPTWASLAH